MARASRTCRTGRARRCCSCSSGLLLARPEARATSKGRLRCEASWARKFGACGVGKYRLANFLCTGTAVEVLIMRAKAVKICENPFLYAEEGCRPLSVQLFFFFFMLIFFFFYESQELHRQLCSGICYFLVTLLVLHMLFFLCFCIQLCSFFGGSNFKKCFHRVCCIFFCLFLYNFEF